MTDSHFVSWSSYDWTLGSFGILPWNPTVYALTGGLFAVSFWLTIELTFQVFFNFKKRGGLYFYSILITTWGVALQSIGLILKLYVPCNAIFSSVWAKIGWVSDTTGFALVLYSRLHLVLRNPRTLNLVLAMIITNALIFHTPIVVLVMGISTGHHQDWVKYEPYFERVMVIGFSLQEAIISGIYIWTMAKFLRLGYKSQQQRNVIFWLIAVQVTVFLSDVFLITIDYMDMFTLKVICTPFSYAVKLKIEFVVLNLLLTLVKGGLTTAESGKLDASHAEDGPVPLSGLKSDVAGAGMGVRATKWANRKRFSIFSGAPSTVVVPTPSTTPIPQPTSSPHPPPATPRRPSIVKTEQVDISWEDRTRTNSVAFTESTINKSLPLPWQQQQQQQLQNQYDDMTQMTKLGLDDSTGSTDTIEYAVQPKAADYLEKQIDAMNAPGGEGREGEGKEEQSKVDDLERQYLGRFGLK